MIGSDGLHRRIDGILGIGSIPFGAQATSIDQYSSASAEAPSLGDRLATPLTTEVPQPSPRHSRRPSSRRPL
jgi:hypothetical protein